MLDVRQRFIRFDQKPQEAGISLSTLSRAIEYAKSTAQV